MKILITGCVGFIGFHLTMKLLKNRNINVYGIDNINSYYDINLKKNRLKELKKNSLKNFYFKKVNIADKEKIHKFFKFKKFDYVIHLAAQAGVRNSIENPHDYILSNLVGFHNILYESKKIKHFLYASTSSVYGNNSKFPLKENFRTDEPLSLYAATKKSNEVIAYSYSNIFKLPTTGMRFFTVYGPYGRPDMALFKFVKSIINSNVIELFNNGNHDRDFTYIDDIVNSIYKLINKPPSGKVPHRLINIGNGKPIKLKNFLSIIEKKLGRKTKIKLLNLQIGDVVKTHADVKLLHKLTKYKPQTTPLIGITKFVNWFKKYYE